MTGGQGARNVQRNTASSGGTVNANQGTQNVNTYHVGQSASRLRRRAIYLVVLIMLDVLSFMYGMLAYTGTGTTGDHVRAWTFMVLLVVTIRTVRSWIRNF